VAGGWEQLFPPFSHLSARKGGKGQSTRSKEVLSRSKGSRDPDTIRKYGKKRRKATPRKKLSSLPSGILRPLITFDPVEVEVPGTGQRIQSNRRGKRTRIRITDFSPTHTGPRRSRRLAVGVTQNRNPTPSPPGQSRVSKIPGAKSFIDR